jgi:hypothetical protein
MVPEGHKILELGEEKSSKPFGSKMRQLSKEINHSFSSSRCVLIIFQSSQEHNNGLKHLRGFIIVETTQIFCSEFCTRENWQTAVLFLAQEMELLALPSPCTKVGVEGYSIYT